MHRPIRMASGLGLGIALLGGALTRGHVVLAFQRSASSAIQGLGSASSSTVPTVSGRSGAPYSGPDNPFDGPGRDGMEDKRAKMVSSERQRMMAKEADLIVQDAAQLQASVAGGADLSREDLFKRADAIEKLARNVKERMKGAR